MTHDELIHQIKEWDYEDYAAPLAERLLAVVELHNPANGFKDTWCGDCDNPYPCPTIQAIEKELK